MSTQGDRPRKTHIANSPLHPQSTTDRFKSVDIDKPDSNKFDLGSPVSPLRPNRAASVSAPSTNTSSSSSSSGSVGGNPKRAPCPGPKSTGHRRLGSNPVASSVNSVTSNANVIPLGNICPSGKIGRSVMMERSCAKSDVLGSGTVNYGHGSIVRGGGRSGSDAGQDVVRKAMVSSDPEEVKRVGNELYRRGQFGEALKLYDRAIVMCPDNVACRSNRAATLMAMGRMGEAVRECENAVRMDPGYGRARQRLASLYLRLGNIDEARKHLYWSTEVPDPVESQKLQAIERHLQGCSETRKIRDWKGLLKESEAAVAAGADSSMQLIATRAEALFRLHQFEQSDCALSDAIRLEAAAPSNSHAKFYGFLGNSYLYMVKAQIEMALGRFESAESCAARAKGLDPQNKEVTMVLDDVRMVTRARVRGNELFKSGKFADACLAYGEGLKFDPCNSVLYCNRAACHSKLEQWKRSIEDCNEALKIQPNYTKALLRRAASYEKLEKWDEAVRDYELLRKELPHDNTIAEALFHAQIALKTSHGEEVSNMTFGGDVEEIVSIEQFSAAICLPGVSVVYFMAPQNQHCVQVSPFLDILCHKYPTINFHKVNTIESEVIAKRENVRTLPTFKFYKNGVKIKEIICPSEQVLEYSVKHYTL